MCAARLLVQNTLWLFSTNYKILKDYYILEAPALIFFPAHKTLHLGPGLLCSKFCLLCFWAMLKKFAHYAQYYAHES